MIKIWQVKCEANMDAQTEVNIIVKANTERKAKMKAEDECRNKGYFHVRVLSCKEITKESENVSE